MFDEYLTIPYAVAVLLGILVQYKFHVFEWVKEKLS